MSTYKSWSLAQRWLSGTAGIWIHNHPVPLTTALRLEGSWPFLGFVFPVDNGPAGDRKTGTATVYVEVLDVNDNRPIFLQNSYETTVLENVPRGSSVLQVRTFVHTARFNTECKHWYDEKTRKNATVRKSCVRCATSLIYYRTRCFSYNRSLRLVKSRTEGKFLNGILGFWEMDV